MTLQMNYQEKYEQGVEQEKRQSALRMIEAGKLSPEEIALYSGLTLERVYELEKELQPVQLGMMNNTRNAADEIVLREMVYV